MNNDKNERPSFRHLAYMLGMYSNRTIPQTYINEMSNYELLLALMNKVNEIIERTIEYDDILIKIQAVLDDLEQAVKDEVERILNEMYEDGEFDEILRESAETYLANIPLNTPLNFKRVYRAIFNIGDNNRYATIAVRPSALQSGTYLSYNGIDYYIYCIIPEGVNSPGHSNTGDIIAVNVSTGAIAGAVAVPFEHMNSCDYNPYDHNLYISGTLNYTNPSDTSSNPSNLVFTIDIEEIVGVSKGGLNKNFTDVLQLDDISYYQPSYSTWDFGDFAEWPGVSTNNISYGNNLGSLEMYVGYSYAMVYKVNFFHRTCELIGSSSLNTQIANLFSENSGMVMQTGSVHGNYYYLVTHNPGLIIRCNLTTQKIEYIYNLPQLSDNGYYVIGEPECVKVLDNGDIYLFSFSDIFQTKYRQYRICQIFKSNIFTNYNYLNIPDKKEPLTIYVDRLNVNYNPDGSAGKPFNSIAEAIHFCNSTEVADAINVMMRSNSNMGVEVTGNKKIAIMRDTSHMSETGEDYNKPSIGGLICSGALLCILENISVHMSYPSTNLPSGYVQAYQSNLMLNSVFMSYNNQLSLNVCYWMNYCTGVLTGAGDFSVQDGYESGNNGIPWTSTGTFIQGTAISFNAHGWAHVDGKGIFA